jgi:hypothetical protein
MRTPTSVKSDGMSFGTHCVSTKFQNGAATEFKKHYILHWYFAHLPTLIEISGVLSM